MKNIKLNKLNPKKLEFDGESPDKVNKLISFYNSEVNRRNSIKYKLFNFLSKPIEKIFNFLISSIILKNIPYLRKIYIKIKSSSISSHTNVENHFDNNQKIGKSIIYQSLPQINFNEKKILIAKLDHIGDFFIAQPILLKIRENFINAEIDIVVGSWNEKFAKDLGIFNKIYVKDYLHVDKKKRAKVTKREIFFQNNYDIYLNLRYGNDCKFFDNYVQAKKHIYPSNNEYQKQTDNFTISENILPQGLTNNFYFINSLAGPLTNKQEVKNLSYYFDSKNISEKIKNLNNFILISPTSNSPLRSMSPKLLETLIKGLKNDEKKIVLVGKSDYESFSNIKDDNEIYNLINRTNLDEYLYLINNSSKIITVNSATSHFSSLIDKRIKIFVFFFGTHHPKEWGPISDNISTFIFSEIKCSPCHLSLVSECPFNLECKEYNQEEIDKIIKHINE